MHVLLCRNNQKNVFQEEIKDWALKPIYWLRKPVLDSRWLNHWKWLVSDLMHLVLEFLSNGGGLNCFSWHVLPKLSKITETCPKVNKMDRIGSIFDLPKVSKININFGLLKVSRMTSLNIYISSVTEKLETSNLAAGKH